MTRKSHSPLKADEAALAALAALAVGCFLFPGEAFCAVWSAKPGVDVSSGYDSNVTLGQGEPRDAIFAMFGLTFDGGMETERSALDLSGGATARRYLGESDLNDEIWMASLKGGHELTERFGAGFSLNYLRDMTMDSEFYQTGEAVTRTPRRHYSGGINFHYLPLDTTELKFAGEHSETRYQSFNRRDSESDRAWLELGHKLSSETGSIVVRPSYTALSSPVADTDSVALEVGWLQARSETLDLHAYLGGRRSRLDPSDAAPRTDWGIWPTWASSGAGNWFP